MKSITVVAAVSALATQVSGHYIFEQFTYGGTKYPVYQYIRKNTNYNSPITDLTSTDLRCNQGGGNGTDTETIAVTAGSAFSFTADVTVYHNGPIAMYMGKAPTTAAAWDGSGQAWFKIWELGPTFNPVTWPLFDVYNATIPASLPAGEYLLRIEQLALHNPLPNLPQLYIECAQVRVTSGGSGTPGPLVSIPGHIKSTDPGYTVNIYNNFNNYTFVGPPVWTGGNVVTPTTTRGPTTLATTTTTTRAATTTSTRAGATTTTTARPTTTTTTTARAMTTTTTSGGGGGGGTVPKYGQCGGQGWTGGTVCAAGSTCTFSNAFYSQCL